MAYPRTGVMGQGQEKLKSPKISAAEARARRKGGVGGIPPRPSIPPERSGGGHFRSKNVRVELYNSTKI